MSLGAALQNIVTETEQDAKKMVEYLRTNNLGRASFLPIASVKGNKLEKYNSKGINGIIGIVMCMMNAINRIPFSIKRVPIFIWNMIVLAIVTIIFHLCKI